MKEGIDYFPLCVQLDDKFELIEAEFGLSGFAIVVKLLQKIYGGFGYYCEWTNEVALLFARRVCVGGNAVSEIVSASIKRGIFDKEMFDKHGILTSSGIQKRYLEAVARRKEIFLKKEYLLIPIDKIPSNVSILSENVHILGENDNILKQSRVKKSKVDKRESREKSVLGFSPPTLKEVEEYVSERGNKINAERFFRYYTACGWKIGRKLMEDWKSVVELWEASEKTDKKDESSSRLDFNMDDIFETPEVTQYDNNGSV